MLAREKPEGQGRVRGGGKMESTMVLGGSELGTFRSLGLCSAAGWSVNLGMRRDKVSGEAVFGSFKTGASKLAL